MLLGTESEKSVYKFKKFRKISRAQIILSEMVGIALCGVIYVFYAKVAAKKIKLNHLFMLSDEFSCMLITYSLMGGIIFIAIVMSNVCGFGLITSFHLSFEVTLQERVMRF